MLNYKTVNGYQIPDLKIPDEQVTLGKYGRMRKAYLQEHRKMLFNSLLLTGKLTTHLAEIDQTVRNALNFITVRHVDSVIAAALDFSKCRTEQETEQAEPAAAAAPEASPLTPVPPVKRPPRKPAIRQ